jgi:hypothetical protein
MKLRTKLIPIENRFIDRSVHRSSFNQYTRFYRTNVPNDPDLPYFRDPSLDLRQTDGPNGEVNSIENRYAAKSFNRVSKDWPIEKIFDIRLSDFL